MNSGRVYYYVPSVGCTLFTPKGRVGSWLFRRAVKHIPFAQQPIGGIKVLYQHCYFLNRAGIGAYPLLDGRFTSPWEFEGVVEKRLGRELPEISERDVVVYPDISIDQATGLPGRKVVFLQAWSQLYNPCFSLNPYDNYRARGFEDVITCSQFVSSRLRDVLMEESHVLRNGIDHSKFCERPERRRPFSIAWLSYKRPGDMQQIRSRVWGRFDRPITFVPICGLSEYETIERLQSSDIFFATGYPEGFSLPPLEAMACGCAVVGFTGGGASEFMVDGETALVAPDGNCEVAAEKLLQVLCEPELKERLRKAGKRKAHEYTFAHMERAVIEYWQARLGA